MNIIEDFDIDGPMPDWLYEKLEGRTILNVTTSETPDALLYRFDLDNGASIKLTFTGKRGPDQKHAEGDQ